MSAAQDKRVGSIFGPGRQRMQMNHAPPPHPPEKGRFLWFPSIRALPHLKLVGFLNYNLQLGVLPQHWLSHLRDAPDLFLI